MTEKDWQATVVQLAGMYRWASYHTFDSRRSDPGWPDLVLARAPELVIVELKTDTGKVSDAQHAWLLLLEACGVETHVWRPRDLDSVIARLS